MFCSLPRINNHSSTEPNLLVPLSTSNSEENYIHRRVRPSVLMHWEYDDRVTSLSRNEHIHQHLQLTRWLRQAIEKTSFLNICEFCWFIMSDLSYILHLTSTVSWASVLRYVTGDIVLEWHVSNFILTRRSIS